MDFISSTNGPVTIETINMYRATMKEAGEMKEILLKEINTGCRKLIIDLSKCEFIDSTFLGTLVVALKAMNGFGGNMRLAGMHKTVESMFALTKLDKLFKSFPTLNEAIKSFE